MKGLPPKKTPPHKAPVRHSPIKGLQTKGPPMSRGPEKMPSVHQSKTARSK